MVRNLYFDLFRVKTAVGLMFLIQVLKISEDFSVGIKSEI